MSIFSKIEKVINTFLIFNKKFSKNETLAKSVEEREHFLKCLPTVPFIYVICTFFNSYWNDILFWNFFLLILMLTFLVFYLLKIKIQAFF